MISVIGAECTGKTRLCTELAQRLPAVQVAEFLRDWVDRHGRTPSALEQHQIISGQRAAEQQAVSTARRSGLEWVVVDSSPLLTAVYSLEYFDDGGPLADAVTHQRHYALTLVTGIGIAWQADGLQRDGPARRDSAQRRLIAILDEQGIAYHLVDGNMTERDKTSLALVRTLAGRNQPG